MVGLASRHVKVALSGLALYSLHNEELCKCSHSFEYSQDCKMLGASFWLHTKGCLNRYLECQLLSFSVAAGLPVRDGRLGVASSAFLASAVSTLALQNRILPRISDRRDTVFHECLTFWSDATSATPLTEPASHRQHAWDRLCTAWGTHCSMSASLTSIGLDFWGLVLRTQATGCLRRLFLLVVCFWAVRRSVLLLVIGSACYWFFLMFVCAVAWWTAKVCMALCASGAQTNMLTIALSTTLYI